MEEGRRFLVGKVKGHKFVPVLLEETDKTVQGPKRGWYRIITYDLSKEIKTDRLEMVQQMLDPTEELVLLVIDISAYKECEIPKEAMDKLSKLLGIFGEHRDIILRVTYDHEGHAYEREPGSFTIVKKHLEQVAEFVQHNHKQLFVYQGLLVGNWGEMHSSRYVTSDRLKVLADLMYRKMETVTDVPLSVRCPYQWRRLHEENALPDPNLSLFDDAIFGSVTDMGTFGDDYAAEKEWGTAWDRESEMSFIRKICNRLPFGGEAVYGDGYVEKLSQEEQVRQLRKMQVSYLNCQHDLKILDYWKHTECTLPGVFEGKSMYDYIGAHLGYRFVIGKVKKSFPGMLGIYIENRGFADLCEKVSLFLEWENGSVKKEICLTEDFSVEAGKGKWFKIKLSGIIGELYIRLQRKGDGRIMDFANK